MNEITKGIMAEKVKIWGVWVAILVSLASLTFGAVGFGEYKRQITINTGAIDTLQKAIANLLKNESKFDLVNFQLAQLVSSVNRVEKQLDDHMKKAP